MPHSATDGDAPGLEPVADADFEEVCPQAAVHVDGTRVVLRLELKIARGLEAVARLEDDVVREPVAHPALKW